MSAYAAWSLLFAGAALLVLVALMLGGAGGYGDALLDETVRQDPTAPLGARLWATAGQRVAHDTFGCGSIIAVQPDGILVAFDLGAVVTLLPSEVDPITPDDERLLASIWARRPRIVRAGEPLPNDLAAAVAPPYCDGLLRCPAHVDRPTCSCCRSCPITDTGEDTR